jgi:hypothetical protein
MRAVALAVLVLGAAAYFLPEYRVAVPFRIPIASQDSHILGMMLGGIGIVLMAAAGRG